MNVQANLSSVRFHRRCICSYPTVQAGFLWLRRRGLRQHLGCMIWHKAFSWLYSATEDTSHGVGGSRCRNDPVNAMNQPRRRCRTCTKLQRHLSSVDLFADASAESRVQPLESCGLRSAGGGLCVLVREFDGFVLWVRTRRCQKSRHTFHSMSAERNDRLDFIWNSPPGKIRVAFSPIETSRSEDDHEIEMMERCDRSAS